MSSWVARISHSVRNPAYAARRLALAMYELAHPGEPWISRGAVRFCEGALRVDMTVLEWGSGRSTVWFARRVSQLTSVEHDRVWYERMTESIVACGNVDYRYIGLDHPPTLPTLLHYEPLPRYVAVANEFEDESLDFVVVDGHYRQACIIAAAPKVRRGGLLLVDNWNRLPASAWGVSEEFVMRHKSANAMTETAIFEKG